MKKSIFTKDHIYLVNQLKKARRVIGFKQVKAANLLGKSQSYISKIESGQRRLDIVQLKKFAKIYRKTLNYFIS